MSDLAQPTGVPAPTAPQLGTGEIFDADEALLAAAGF